MAPNDKAVAPMATATYNRKKCGRHMVCEKLPAHANLIFQVRKMTMVLGMLRRSVRILKTLDRLR